MIRYAILKLILWLILILMLPVTIYRIYMIYRQAEWVDQNMTPVEGATVKLAYGDGFIEYKRPLTMGKLLRALNDR